MSRICVITADGGAYYAIVSRLRSAGLPFLSLLPTDDTCECGLVITTRKEAALLTSRTISVEDLDENPDVARGEILSKLSEGEETLVVGIDPGSRIGAAAFLGDVRLASRTFNSRRGACAWVVNLLERVPSSRAVVRVGDGDPGTARWFAGALVSRIPGSLVEIVDESGTSRSKGAKGLQKDQGSAAKIAFRKGVIFRQESHVSRNR